MIACAVVAAGDLRSCMRADSLAAAKAFLFD
jgi:hypothetical protein